MIILPGRGSDLTFGTKDCMVREETGDAAAAWARRRSGSVRVEKPDRSRLLLMGLRLGTVAVMVGGLLLTWQSGIWKSPTELLVRLQSIGEGPLAPLAFWLVFSVGLGFGMPASPFVVSGGVLFGVWPGTLYNLLGLLCGASLAFGIGRFLGRHWVLRWTGGTLERLDKAVSRNGFQAILTMRLMPLIPFNLSNFAAGVTGVRLKDYVLATLLGMLPGIGMVTWFAQSIVAGLEGEALGWRIGGLSIFLLSISWLPRLLRRWGFLTAEVEDALRPPEDPLDTPADRPTH